MIAIASVFSRTSRGFVGAVLAVSLATLAVSAQALTLEDLREQERQVQALAEKAIPATVAILSERSGATGSGVVVSAEGLVLTAGHVIQGTEGVLVVFPDGRTVRGKTLGRNLSRDVGMVQITDPGPYPFVEVAPAGSLDKLEIVVAMGHPGGFDPARTPPLRIGRVMNHDPDGFVWTDCALIGGDSGGPLYDLDGRVVGIHSSIGGDLSQNRHACADAFHEDWDRLAAGDSWGSLGIGPLRAGDPNRPVVGIVLDEQADPALRVKSLVEGGPGAAAGIQVGDVVASVDGRKVEGYEAYQDLLGSRDAGDEVAIGVRRGDQELTFTVKLAKASDLDPGLAERQRRGREEGSRPPGDDQGERGAFLGALLRAGDGGPEVAEVLPDGPAASAGLAAGDVILSVNGERVETSGDLIGRLNELAPGTKVNLKVRRDGAELDFEVVLGKRPS